MLQSLGQTTSDFAHGHPSLNLVLHLVIQKSPFFCLCYYSSLLVIYSLVQSCLSLIYFYIKVQVIFESITVTVTFMSKHLKALSILRMEIHSLFMTSTHSPAYFYSIGTPCYSSVFQPYQANFTAWNTVPSPISPFQPGFHLPSDRSRVLVKLAFLTLYIQF